ncbi:polysaccharide deacetylase family protein [Roseibium denhamense]|uniref:Chitooligosaccharide deacetylase n=1 Tax=Roseibium denhamense TaxID=76305 RepID=A0ABY1NQ09_9HYPH|nr:polysaccharide deacetylase family protein [Roseibium denhamense]SMP14950.1 Polysaccharide deacetylase [Roseibium denhamense]
MARLLNRALYAHVILYHAVFETVPDAINTHFHNVTPDVLYAQLAWMKQYFDFVTVDELRARPDREGTCAVTFDDAYKSVFQNALPVLNDLKIPATVFVIGSTLSGSIFWRDKIRWIMKNGATEDFLEAASPFCTEHGIRSANFYKQTKSQSVHTAELVRHVDDFLQMHEAFEWDALKLCAEQQQELLDHPLLSYGNHTHHHYVLPSLEADAKRAEIGETAKLLTECGKKLSGVFSIPFGGRNMFDAETLRLIHNAGYDAVLLSRTRVNHVTRGALPEISGVPYLERYMAPETLEMFQDGIVALIADAAARATST